MIFILCLCIENHTEKGIHFTPRKSMKITLDDSWSEYHTLLGMSIVTSEIISNLVRYQILYFHFCCEGRLAGMKRS